MLFANIKRRIRNQSQSASTTYVPLEPRQLLAFAPLPEMTTDVAAYAQTVDDAIVRVDDQQRLIIRTTAEQNRIDIRLEFNYIQVNRELYGSFALEIDPNQYSQIILLSDGQDAVRVSGNDLSAQMHPGRFWVATDVESNDDSAIEINGSNFEHAEVNGSDLRDVGPYIHRSNNRIRMYGSEGIDYLEMASDNDFAIATSAVLTGDGYYSGSNVFGDLFVTGSGGDDFALLMGTRGFSDSAFLVSDSTSGDDTYSGRDNVSRISNGLWDGRFLDFETQRIDLLSGDDRGFINDAERGETYYRVDGEHLVGSFRRMIGIETIEIDGADNSPDTLYRPDPFAGQFSGQTDQYRYVFTAADHSEDSDTSVGNLPPLSGDFIGGGGLAAEIVPANFSWTFSGFEQLLD